MSKPILPKTIQNHRKSLKVESPWNSTLFLRRIELSNNYFYISLTFVNNLSCFPTRSQRLPLSQCRRCAQGGRPINLEESLFGWFLRWDGRYHSWPIWDPMLASLFHHFFHHWSDTEFAIDCSMSLDPPQMIKLQRHTAKSRKSQVRKLMCLSTDMRAPFRHAAPMTLS